MSFVANGTDRPVLDAIRELLQDADEALLCSAFVDDAGLMLVGRELRELGQTARLVTTTVFGGGRTLAALDRVHADGVRCRVLNPGRGTFHSKVFVARHGDVDTALIGSANLTRGLVANVEAAVLQHHADPMVRNVAETWWRRGVDLAKIEAAREADVLDVELYEALAASIAPGDVIMTLGGTPRPNVVHAVERTGLLVETEATRRKGTGPQLVEPRMLQVAWDALRTDGDLTNRRLLHDLRVMRSSFVCAALAALPGVTVVSRRPISLRWHDQTDDHIHDLAAEHRSTYGSGGST